MYFFFILFGYDAIFKGDQNKIEFTVRGGKKNCQI